ncbi:MAG: hypothetical protein R3F55_10625 [Alphaproteobacteria bacterium]
MIMSRFARAGLLPAAAVAAAIAGAPAQAQYVDDVTAFLAQPDLAGRLSYGGIVEQPSGGIEITDIRVTNRGLADLTFGVRPDTVPDADTVALRIDRLYLDEGMLGLVFGMRGATAEPETIGLAVDGLALDLAAASGAEGMAMLQRYVGGVAAITGSGVLTVLRGDGDWHDVDATLDLDGLGRFQMAIQFDGSQASPARGTLSFTDTAAHPLVGIGAYLHRAALENMAELAEELIATVEATAAGQNRDQVELALAPARQDLERTRALLAGFPDDGRGAAADIAAWADTMAAAMPQHRALFDAVIAFAGAPGTLVLTLAPDGTQPIPRGVGFTLETYADPAAVGGVISAYGISGAFMPAE